MEISKSLLTEINLLDVLIIIIYLLGIVYLSKKFIKISNKFFKFFIIIGLFHFAFTLFYYNYSLNNISDSVGFYRRTLYFFENWSDAFGQGSFFLYFILYPLVHYIGVSYFGLFFIFSFIGLLGFYYLFKITINIKNYKWTNWYYLLLLPNVHFWTVSIGKDSLIYFGICLLLYIYYFKKKWLYFITPLFIIAIIRLHILIFIVIAFLMATTLLNKKIKTLSKIILISIFLGLMYIGSSFIFDRVGIENLNKVSERLNDLQMVNQGGGSSVNMVGENIITKWLAFLFRPFFFDAHNLFAVIISIENIVWVLLVLKLFFNKNIKFRTEKAKLFYWIFLLNILLISLPLAYILTNLGIAIRQKTMIFPFILVAFFILKNASKRPNLFQNNSYE